MKNLIKIIQPLLLIVLTISLMMLLKAFLIPFMYGLLIALIVYPICKGLEKRKFPRSLAIFISIFIVAIVLGAIITILVIQINVLNNEVPQLSNRLSDFLLAIQKWIEANFGISILDQHTMIVDTGKNLSSNIGKMIAGSISLAAKAIFNLVIIPLYVALILYYRRVLVDFISSLIGEKHKENLPTILSETIHIYFNYIKGMLLVYIIVGILNSIGLLALGVNYAILFGMVTAFMTIIPYLGIIISSILPITFVWMETNNILYPLGVIAVFSVVQYLEANIIFPYIVGKQLGINMFISIVSILIGGVIWGVSGMILFLPFVALIKIISGHIEALKPLNKLLEIPR